MTDSSEQDEAEKPKHIGGKWPKGVSGNPGGRPKTKPFKEALQRVIDAMGGPDAAAQAIMARALTGDVAAFRECADRLDGKVPQSVVGGGDEDDNPIKIETIRRIIVRPGHPDSGSVPAATVPSTV